MTSLAPPPNSAAVVPRHHHTPITTAAHRDTSMGLMNAVTLPRLRIPTDSEVFAQGQQHQQHQQHQWTASQHQHAFQNRVPVPYEQQQPPAKGGPLTRSPSSPAAFFADPDNKFGLTHLLEAAEQCLPVPVRPSANASASPPSNMFQQEPGMLRKRSFSEREPQQQQPMYYTPQQQSPFHQQPQQLPSMMNHKMPSLGYLVPADDDRSYKRSRPELNGFLSGAGYSTSSNSNNNGFQFQQQQQQQPAPSPSYHHQSPSYGAQSAPVFRSPVMSSMASPSGSCSPSASVPMPSMIWETVIQSGKFPSDVCLSETSQSGSGANKGSSSGGDASGSSSSSTPSSSSSSSSAPSSENPVKQGRWSCGEKEFAEALIESVQKGETLLPPNTSLRKFIADSLQCKAMRVSKKFRSLRSCASPSQNGSASPTDSDDASQVGSSSSKSFNPLSLSSIMNNEGGAVAASSSNQYESQLYAPTAPSTAVQESGGKKAQRVLKRSDYSQHGMVRSGRWSLEEENYAKAMIEAFKSGYLPLHGNVSLRKFLSEVLVCHPMRISKKFVGYVRKYHWYRIAAGKCDPEAKHKALEELAHLERAFWASMQQSSDWSLAAQDE